MTPSQISATIDVCPNCQQENRSWDYRVEGLQRRCEHCKHSYPFKFIKFARSSEQAKRVSGSAEGRADRSPSVGTFLSGMGMETPNPYTEQIANARSAKPTSEYQASPADSKNTLLAEMPN